MLKKGGPTEILSPVKPSKNNGYNVPKRTINAAIVRNKLFSKRPASRLMGAKNLSLSNEGARYANKDKDPPMDKANKISI